METIKPNFFLVGAVKAGTTSLYEYLKQHPEIYFSPIKEPNYFSTDIKTSEFSNTYRKNTIVDVDSYFRQTKLPPLQLAFVRKPEHYRRLFEDVSGEKAIGEASTSYLYSEIAATNIRKYQPEARIIVIIRNPIDRVISHYQMALRYGHTKRSFREAVKKDWKTQQKGWGISELFIELGLYYRQLKRYFDAFDNKRIRVFLFEDLINYPRETVLECQRFLGTEEILPEAFETFNPASIPKFKYLNKLITDSGMKNLIQKILPAKNQEQLKNLFFFEKAYNKITQKDKHFLVNIYKHDIENTSMLINRDLSHWLE